MLPTKLREHCFNTERSSLSRKKYMEMGMSDSTKVLCIRLFLFSIYVLAGAAIFQAIERQEHVREIERIRITRKEILTKYNITQSDAQRWSETFLSTSPGNDDFLEWNFGNSFLFAMVVLTTIGKTSEICDWWENLLNPWTCNNIIKLCLLPSVICRLRLEYLNCGSFT